MTDCVVYVGSCANIGCCKRAAMAIAAKTATTTKLMSRRSQVFSFRHVESFESRREGVVLPFPFGLSGWTISRRPGWRSR